ncbi:TetR/AcrR family transcriptional regulator [Modestobacter excelsi]|uniref:TetR/AcrR family transcriptional regulator n=1 Tax=Modestobacter excelsi TaxID=2213161 RepID=UPI002482DBD3|nr:TetR/AcrR family transcriptional regulator [Modestobacter excelsi]
MTTTGTDRRPPSASRARVEEAALQLFAQDGVSGTSLQMIADAMGVTKAAVYWHYRSKDELVLGVLRPVLEALDVIAADAASPRGRRARVETILTGIVDLFISNRRRLTMVLADATVRQLLAEHPPLTSSVDRVIDLMSSGPGDSGSRTAAVMFLAGLQGAAADPICTGLGDEVLRAHLLDCGRRLLHVRRPSD